MTSPAPKPPNPLPKFLIVLGVLFLAAVALLHDRVSTADTESKSRLEIFYMYNEGESQSVWFREAADRFEQLHPGLKVDILFAGREVFSKLRPRMIMGNPPDIVNQGGDQLEVLMVEDLFEPIDSALSTPAFGSDLPWKDTFRPGMLEIYTWEGRYYQVPMGLFVTVFFYNVDQFEKLHLTPPKTWDEFLRVCQVFKDNGIEPIAADGTEIGYNVMWYMTLIGRMSNRDHVRATAWNEPGTSWQEKVFVDAAKSVRELRDRGYVMSGYEGSKWPSAQMLWVQGKCGLLLNGTWIPKEMKNKLPENFRMGLFRFPIVEGYPDSAPWNQDLGADCLAIPKGARHKEMAVEFMKYVTSPDEMKRLAALDVPCSVRGVPMPPSLADLDSLIAPPYKLVKSVSGVDIDLSNWYRNVARNRWSDLFLGLVEPEEMCRDMDAAQKRFYEGQKKLGKPSN